MSVMGDAAVRDFVKRVRESFPNARRYRPVFYDVDPATNGIAIHTLQNDTSDIDGFLADPTVSQFELAGVLVVLDIDGISVAAQGPREDEHRRVLRSSLKQHLGKGDHEIKRWN